MHPNDPDNVWPPGEEDAERDAEMDARNEAHAEPPGSLCCSRCTAPTWSDDDICDDCVAEGRRLAGYDEGDRVVMSQHSAGKED